MYRLLFAFVLARLSAESMHKLGFFLLRTWMALPFAKALTRRALAPADPADRAVLGIEALGLSLESPLGLAAGFDKDAEGYEALYALGFGYVEIGTLTGHAQSGNPKPRMFRLVADRALINRLGFNNRGSEAAVARLARPRSLPLGVNIGKTKVVPEDRAIEDYVLSAERVGRHADYMVVNVSSPNTPGLRNLQAVSVLEPLLLAVREALARVSPGRSVPLLVKIAPDLADEDIDAVADMALRLSLDGIIATNTTISRSGLSATPERITQIGAGGLSGAPLRARSLTLLRRLYARTQGRITLIGVGGISSAEDALERILAGATLIQAYTGFIYGGPLWPSQLNRELARLLRARGFSSVKDAVGKG